MAYKLLGLIAASVVSQGSTAHLAELNALRDLRITPTATGAQVRLHGSTSATFTAFRLSNPDRIVVDVSGADTAAIKGEHDGVGPITKIVASQFSDAQANVGRVLLSVASGTQYDVRAENNDVVIAVNQPTPTDQNSAPAGNAETTAQSRNYPENVIAAETDERPVTHAAHHLKAISLRKNELRIVTDGEIGKYQIIQLVSPARLALEVYDLKSTIKAPSARNGYIKDLRLGTYPDKLRLVIEAQESEFPIYELNRVKNGLRIHFRDKAALSTVPSQSKPRFGSAEPRSSGSETEAAEMEVDGRRIDLAATENAPLPMKAVALKAPEESAAVVIADVKFDEKANGGEVSIKASRPLRWKTERIDAQSVALVIENATLPRKLERTFDTTALNTPIRSISSFSVPSSRVVRIVATANRDLTDAIDQAKHGVLWRLSAIPTKTESVSVKQQAAAAEATDNPTFASEGSSRRSRYSGKRMTFEFKDIDLHNFLRVIADISKKNIVVGDDVKGTVTLRLRNVPWDQALDVVLRSRGLGKEDLGNILRIAPLKVLEEEVKLRAERAKAARVAEPLHVQLIPVNYAKAEEMSSRVKEVLSERGTASVDVRTNVLIVRDIEANLGKARSLVQSLDLQTPQVLIESRIVEANTSFSRQIGVQWGGNAQMAPATGNPTGLVFPYSAGVRGGINGTAPGLIDQPNFAVNLPAGVGQGAGGALGFTFGSAGGAVALNLRLSAAEAQGTVKTISAPKVTTMDNTPATISQGVSIPFSQSSASGVNTTFVEARLSLNVTPHITQDGSVMMQINAQNNQPDPANSGSNGQPGIQRKEASTQVLVKDSDTTVIGGIYVRRGSNAIAEVPFFSKIPLLGFFFKTVSETDNRQELLIFITPHIINRQTVAQSL